jgi:demethylmenaquinone methyltransferase/2-methoxy-6-polyprenyl-1,4-benzoquinol methylase
MAEKVENITPYDDTSSAKHEQVRSMFNSIAPVYDIMNRLMTFGIDKHWRALTVKTVRKSGAKKLLDIATGTGDLAIKLAKEIDGSHVTGVDLSEGMIAVGQQKVDQANLSDRITLATADALQLPFPDNSFDAITVAYGVRNFEHLDKGYLEMLRVLRPGGLLCVLELTPPSSPMVKPFYAAYTRGIIPIVGRLLSNDKRAYTYLPESIAAVPARENMLDLMRNAGFASTSYRSLTFGVCTLYTACK